MSSEAPLQHAMPDARRRVSKLDTFYAHSCWDVTLYAPVTVAPVKPNGWTSFSNSPFCCIADNCWLNCVTSEASDLRKPYPPAASFFWPLMMGMKGCVTSRFE